MSATQLRLTQVRLKDLYALAGIEFLKHGKKAPDAEADAWIERFKRAPQLVAYKEGEEKNKVTQMPISAWPAYTYLCVRKRYGLACRNFQARVAYQTLNVLA